MSGWFMEVLLGHSHPRVQDISLTKFWGHTTLLEYLGVQCLRSGRDKPSESRKIVSSGIPYHKEDGARLFEASISDL